jgi:hypothetical protein
LTPCVEDTIPQDKFELLGTPEDMKARIDLARTDVDDVQKAVEYARNLIYKKGFAVNYSGKLDKLKSRSLVPTRVRCP